MNLNKGCIEIDRQPNPGTRPFKMNLNKGCIEMLQWQKNKEGKNPDEP